MRKLWEQYIDNLSIRDKIRLAYIGIERLIELDEVRFRVDDIIDLDGNLIPEDESMDEFLYWKVNGENLLDG